MMKYTLAISISLLLFCNSGMADSLAKDKKRLENLELQLEQKKEAMDKQKEAVKAMEQKLKCNYNKLEAFNACEEKTKKDSPEYIKCMEKAIEASASCMDKA